MAWTEEEKKEVTWIDPNGWFTGGWFTKGWFTNKITITWTEEEKNAPSWVEEIK